MKDKKEAKTANLARKIRVHKLGFHWSSERESNNDEDVLEGLQPHPNLKSLEIVNFGGEKFIVASCPNLRSFPSLQGVGSLLRRLGISCADEVLPTGLQSCTSLSELNINYCPNLKSIPNLRQLHSLTKLRIMCCQNLTHLPEELDCLTCLESLEIGGFPQSQFHFHPTLARIP